MNIIIRTMVVKLIEAIIGMTMQMIRLAQRPPCFRDRRNCTPKRYQRAPSVANRYKVVDTIRPLRLSAGRLRGGDERRKGGKRQKGGKGKGGEEKGMKGRGKDSEGGEGMGGGGE